MVNVWSNCVYMMSYNKNYVNLYDVRFFFFYDKELKFDMNT